jgi:hypothetical protein
MSATKKIEELPSLERPHDPTLVIHRRPDLEEGGETDTEDDEPGVTKEEKNEQPEKKQIIPAPAEVKKTSEQPQKEQTIPAPAEVKTKKRKVPSRPKLHRGSFNLAVHEEKTLSTKMPLDIIFFPPHVENSLPEEFGLLRSSRGTLAWRFSKATLQRYVIQATHEGYEFLFNDEHGTAAIWIFITSLETPLDSVLGGKKSPTHYVVIHPKTAKKEMQRWIAVTETSDYLVFGSAKVSWLGGADGYGVASDNPEEAELEQLWKDVKDMVNISFAQPKTNKVVKVQSNKKRQKS